MAINIKTPRKIQSAISMSTVCKQLLALQVALSA